MSTDGLLMVRLGAMGDILHALPAAATLRAGYPDAEITWAVEPRWLPLLDGNPHVTRTVAIDRRSWASIRQSATELRRRSYSQAVDMQGLWKSALVCVIAGSTAITGFHETQAREPASTVFYNRRVKCRTTHAVERYVELAEAAGGDRTISFPVPSGRPEGELPPGPFVLANPLAGWASKQWPMQNYAALAVMLRERRGWPLVLNVPESALPEVSTMPDVVAHASGLPGLIDATRRAAAVIGVDSGPLHLAAALGKPGVAIFGPTDPARNGPYGGSLTVLRVPEAETTYRREAEIAESMRAIGPDQVMAALEANLARQAEGRE